MKHNPFSLVAALLAACVKSKPAEPVQPATNGAGYPKFNHSRSRNGYGEFSWQITRRKGHPVAIIQRSGRLYCRLRLFSGESYHAMQTGIVEYLEEQLMREASRK